MIFFTSYHQMHQMIFFTSFENLLQTIDNENKEILILGDLNCDLLN